LQNLVRFDNRVYPLHDIPKIIGDCHLGLVPLEISSVTNYILPLKLIEYTALGLPVVTVKNPAISYYFKDGDCLFYDPFDVESLRAILDSVAERPSPHHTVRHVGQIHAFSLSAGLIRIRAPKFIPSASHSIWMGLIFEPFLFTNRCCSIN